MKHLLTTAALLVSVALPATADEKADQYRVSQIVSDCVTQEVTAEMLTDPESDAFVMMAAGFVTAFGDALIVGMLMEGFQTGELTVEEFVELMRDPELAEKDETTSACVRAKLDDAGF